MTRGWRFGLANWTPQGFIGQLFKLIGAHVPRPGPRQIAGQAALVVPREYLEVVITKG